jgi:hypothetical protein
MKSVESVERRARRFLAGAACTSVIIGFIACSGESEHRTSRSQPAGGDDAGGSAQAGAAGANVAEGGGSLAQAGQSTGGAPGAGAAGDAAVGGETGVAGGVGGEATGGVGGEATGGIGGEATGGAAGAGGDTSFVDPVCGLNLVKVGEYSLWCGKVNEHTVDGGSWEPDADCTSGCNITGVDYCKKFYPTATAVVSVPQVGVKDWKNAGFVSGQSGACNDSIGDGAGISGQTACCAPLP